ncbi:hypothetical protein EDC01DRAFT_729238 [Geopyxis carbonaria]|nr:hypothetical protein EDC01DRAFT_729238 [Geopyxis carbonaria]
MSSKLTIPNPRRLLLLGTPGSGKLSFLKALTGSLPPALAAAETHAGLSHVYEIKNAYYEVALPVWIDEIPAAAPAAATWAADYSGAEAREVLAVIGAFVVTFRKPQDEADLATIKSTLTAAHALITACGPAWDGVCLAVAMPQSLQPHLDLPEDESWDGLARDHGFEFVDFEARGVDEYGEAGGLARVGEALAANDWAGDGDDLSDGGSFGSFEGEGEGGEGGDGDGEGEDVLRPIREEMEREMFGLHDAIMAGGDGREDDKEDDGEIEVERLEAAMMKLAALKELGPGEMSKEERKKLAGSVVRDLMK